MVVDAHAPPAYQEPRSVLGPELRTTTFGLVTIITMIAFEEMAVSPALPTVARDLHGVGAYGWAFTAFLVASIVGMVVAGQRSDGHGPRLPLLLGMGSFLTGLVVAGSATTMAQLVVARGVQGLGGGFLITAAYVVIGETYPEALRPRLFAMTASAWVVPSLVGPVVSGVVTEHASWRWVFLGLLPFALTGCLLLLPTVRRLHRPESHDAALASPGRVLRALVVAAGVAAVQNAGQHPGPWTVALGAIGVVAFFVAVVGLVPPGTLRIRPGVSAPIAMRGVLAGAFFGGEALLPLSLTVQHHWSPTEAGLPLAASGVAWAAGSWYAGREVADPVPRRPRVLRAGFLCVALSLALITVTAVPSAPAWLAYPAWTVGGLGAGLAMPTVSVLMLLRTTDRDRGRDSAALQLSDTGAAALTTGLAGILVAAAARGSIGYTGAFVAMFATMVGIALLGALAAARAR